MDYYFIDNSILIKLANEGKVTLIEELTSNNLVTFFINSNVLNRINCNTEKRSIYKIIELSKIISISARDVRESITSKYPQEYLDVISFKRVCPNGFIVSQNKNYKEYTSNLLEYSQFINKIINPLQGVNIKILDLNEEYRFMMEEIDHSILNILSGAKYILGPEVNTFEKNMSEYLDTPYTIGVSSGTDALILSLRAFAIYTRNQEYFNEDDEIITTPFTFAATGETILRAGAKPVFIDIQADHYNIDLNLLEEYLEKKHSNVKGIIAVHLFGCPCDMKKIMALAEKYGLFVIEDAAQAMGGSFGNKKLGSYGDTGCFSFYPSKNLGAFGDGGLITIKNKNIYELILSLMNHGFEKDNINHIGYNSRLDTLQAGVLLEKMKWLDDFNSKRIEIAKKYSQGLSDLRDKLYLPDYNIDQGSHVFHQFTIRVFNDKRDDLKDYLKDNGIQTMIYYKKPLNEFNIFKNSISFTKKNISDQLSKEVLSLPIEPLMSNNNIETVIQYIRKFYQK